MSTMTDLSQYVSIEDAAALLGVTPRTIRRYIERGVLQGYQRALGRGPWVLLRRDVERLSTMVPIEPKAIPDQGD